MNTHSEARLIGDSDAIRTLHWEIECAARSSVRVLITGESGVGKDVVARLIHRHSQRSKRPLVTINCAGVPDSLLESEMFGHVRGSFTGAYRNTRGWIERAHRGTIFMDEIGDMSLRMQALLLRFLEDGEVQPVGSDRVSSVVDVRVIAATNRDLKSLVTDKRFRDDFYYRLNVIHIPIPPLRERPQDIAPLFSHFFQGHVARHGGVVPVLAEGTMSRLVAYSWPGNVRELKNVAERLVIRTRSGVVTPDELPREISGLGAAPSGSPTATRPKPDRLFERMTVDGESFWSVVYEPFMSRDLTRDDLRAIVGRGLDVTGGNRRALVELFNLGGDSRRFLRFLHNHLVFQSIRSVRVTGTSGTRLKVTSRGTVLTLQHLPAIGLGRASDATVQQSTASSPRADFPSSLSNG
jgi:two-component system response regulator AtoC